MASNVCLVETVREFLESNLEISLLDSYKCLKKRLSGQTELDKVSVLEEADMVNNSTMEFIPDFFKKKNKDLIALK